MTEASRNPFRSHELETDVAGLSLPEIDAEIGYIQGLFSDVNATFIIDGELSSNDLEYLQAWIEKLQDLSQMPTVEDELDHTDEFGMPFTTYARIQETMGLIRALCTQIDIGFDET